MTHSHRDALIFFPKHSMPTPWGVSQYKHEVATSVYIVGSSSHGGCMIGCKVALDYLSPEAIAHGRKWNQWLCYEEDCDIAIIMYEQPKWFTDKYTAPKTTLEIQEIALSVISKYAPDYYKSILNKV